ncbi:RNase Irp1 [Rhodocollybia butyracea]|uniref:RNase Irp1 n=1 Tax=Rhodocollybia butyracea TaxID=206335 RepID=A0A9P5UE64_9AGAR|nr:RNase Irp1 [Rhodocollybia butyracea]
MVVLNGLLRPAVAAASLGAGSFNKRAGSISSDCAAASTLPLSCSTDSSQGTCCFEAPGGLILQTQFWDTSTETGPTDSFTIHGLWPDNCDGTFEESCDPSRDYTGISSLLTEQGATSTLDFMNQFWLNDPDDGSNEELWEVNEWAEHGTCYSTLEVNCLPSGSPQGAEAVAFFEQVVTIFQTLPTYTWLTNQGITPDSSTTHTYTALTDALQAEAGVIPALQCDGSDLSEVYWYFNLRGSIIDGEFEPIDAPSKGSCSSSGIKWLPKTIKN